MMNWLSAIGNRLSARTHNAGGVAARQPKAKSRQPTAQRTSGGGFTLIELMIAIAVLIVVIFATAHIFGTASRVTGTGHAAANVMQEAAVIEKMMREDIARLSTEGFFAIRQVAVPNNIHAAKGGPLLNPMLPPDPFDTSDPNRHRAWIRADQLVFFADGVSGFHTFDMGIAGGGTAIQSQATSSRVYYGHGFQLPDAAAFIPVASNDGHAHDPAQDVLPWNMADVDMLRTRFTINDLAGGTDGTGVFQQLAANAQQPSPIRGRQPEARRWLFVRQAATLAAKDDNAPSANSKTVYLNNRIARSIFRTDPAGFHPRYGWTNEIRNGRMDGAATRIDEIWRYIREIANPSGTFPWDWQQERHVIASEAIYYPRAERHAPGPHRVDQSLTNHVIGSAVSSFIIEWTWSDGIGDRFDDDGERLCQFSSGPLAGHVMPCNLDIGGAREPFGFYTNWDRNLPFQPEQPWFGLPYPERGVGYYFDEGNDTYQQRANYRHADTVFPRNIEKWGDGNFFDAPFDAGPNPAQLRIYEAIFGYNRNTPSAPNPNNVWFDEPHAELAYTPWPTAIRVTLIMHDPQGRLEHGREFQFVIDLPRRTRR